MRYALLFILILIPGTLLSQAQQQSRCKTQPEYRQFDFWVGDWEVKNPNGAVVGTNTIELVAGDCLILENWTSSQGSTGKSMNYYNLLDSKWHQKWVGSNGIPIELSGRYDAESRSLVLTGESLGPGGIMVRNKLTFHHINDDYVRQVWEQSSDEGKTWTTAFDGHYHRVSN